MDVRPSKKQEAKTKTAKMPRRSGKWLALTYLIISVASIILYFLLRSNTLTLSSKWNDLFIRFSLAVFFAFIALASTKFIELIIVRRSHTKGIRYNLIRLMRLIGIMLVGFVMISFLFANWYTAAVSLGLFSLILGFALQTPISSLIGWFYIVMRTPYKVGDRIQLEDFTGDVVEIGYLDTTLWEFHGDYLSNDLPSGRLIRFPNSLVFNYAVYNYSWKKFPYIWNEIPFHIAYESDLLYVETTLKEVTKNIMGEGMAENVNKLKELIQQTPVDELEIKEYPFVTFRVNPNTWVEASITYLVEPKQASSVRSRIIKEAIPALLKEPDRVLFPKGNAR
jgi:small-conductance mechanosensitive channel